MRTLLAMTALLALLTVDSHAGCENYTDGSMMSPAPRVKLCMGGECEVARFEAGCTVAGGVFWEYSTGLRVDSVEGEGLFADIDGNPLTEEEIASIQCQPIDAHLDSCF